MKLTLMILLLPLFSMSQDPFKLPNGYWISNSGSIASASLGLKYDGYVNGAYTYHVWNRTPCEETGADFTVRGIPGHTDTFHIKWEGTKHFKSIAPFRADTIWCKVLTNCSTNYDTCYWGVTTWTALAANPITSTVSLISYNTVKVTFTVTEILEDTYANVRIGTNPQTMALKPKVFHFAKGTKPGTYTSIVKL